jgi:hypothetical protein
MHRFVHVDLKDVTRILKKDYKSDEAQANKLGYYVLINTWLQQIDDWSTIAASYVKRALFEDGLKATIARADKTASQLLEGDLMEADPLFRFVVDEVTKRPPEYQYGTEPTLHWDPMARAMQLLRYPKRYCPVKDEELRKESIRDFLALENRLKLSMADAKRSYTCHKYLYDLVRHELRTMVDWDRMCDEIERVIQDQEIRLSPGVGYDSRQPVGTKLRAIAKTHPEWFQPIMGMPCVVGGVYQPDYLERPKTADDRWMSPTEKKEQDFAFGLREIRPVKVAAVPKSYKAYRIIAMEDTWRQGVCLAIMDVIDRYLPDSIDLHDQSRNAALAKEGSYGGEVATIDLTSASDSIRHTHLIDLYPRRFAHLVLPYLGTHTEIDGRRRVMQKLATSGNGLTFVLESLLFLAIYRAGEHMWQRHSGGSSYPGCPRMYGDDGIVTDAAYATVVDMLTALGFIVNDAKSYHGNIPFRESCGSDWYAGVDISTMYFPRKPIIGSITADKVEISADDLVLEGQERVQTTTLSSLISLQHKMYLVSQRAACFLEDVIQSSQRNMTSSSPSQGLDDVWSAVTHYGHTVAPHDGKWLAEQPNATKATILEAAARQKHCSPVVSYTEPEKLSLADRRLYDSYRYMSFLKYGPRYADRTARLAGVSDAPQSIAEVFGRPTIKWYRRTV